MIYLNKIFVFLGGARVYRRVKPGVEDNYSISRLLKDVSAILSIGCTAALLNVSAASEVSTSPPGSPTHRVQTAVDVASAAKKESGALGQGKRLTLEAARNWRTITDAQLTPDGKWFVYRLTPNPFLDQADKSVVVVLRSTSSAVEKRFSAGVLQHFGDNALQVSPSGRWVAFKTGTLSSSSEKAPGSTQGASGGVSLIELTTGARHDFVNVHRFSFNSRAEDEWIALQEMPSKANQVNRANPSAPAAWNELERSCRADPTQVACPQSIQPTEVADVVLKRLDNGRTHRLAHVEEYSFNSAGTHVAWSSTDGLHVLELASGERRILEVDKGSRYRALTWSPRSRALAVLRMVPSGAQTALLVFTAANSGAPHRQVFLPQQWTGFPRDHVISPENVAAYPRGGLISGTRRALVWRENERGVFFGIRPRSALQASGRSENPTLVLWHWSDSRLPIHRQVDANADRQFSYLSYLSLDTGAFVRLADEDLPFVEPHLRGRHVLAYSGGTQERWADISGQVYRDFHLVDLEQGRRATLVKNLQVSTYGQYAPPPQLSPDGSHVLYMDLSVGGHYIVYDIATGARRNLTRDLPTHFYPTVNLAQENAEVKEVQTAESPPKLVQGWTNDGNRVLVSDYRDVWALSLKGDRAAINLTGNGNSEDIVYEYTDFHMSPRTPYAYERDFLPSVSLNEPLYFRALDKRTMRTGLIRRDSQATTPLRWDDAWTQYYKAEHAEAYIYSRQTAVEFPDYHRLDANWQPTLRLTEANPQQREFAWSPGVRLLSYTTSTGYALRGVLHLPAGYVPGRAYPTIVTVYEMQGEYLHSYASPLEEIARWTHHGYAVFRASNQPRLRESGAAAVEGVLAGVEAAVASGIVDPERLALTGHSYGGYVTNFLVTQTNRFRVAVASAGMSNLISNAGLVHTSRPKTVTFAGGQPYLGAPWWEHWQAYVENSPLFAAHRVQTPLLLVHGEEDALVPFSQALELFNTLRYLGKPVVLLQYKNHGHGAHHDDDAQTRMLELFDHFLKDAPPPGWWANGISLY